MRKNEKSVEESLEFYEPSHEVFANIEIRLRQLQSAKTHAGDRFFRERGA